jgi:hypothetical protein
MAHPGVSPNAAHPLVQIPDATQQILLPEPHLSILHFLEFPLPGITLKTKHRASAFFSEKDPTTNNLSLLSKIPMPSREVLETLHTTCEDAITNGAASVDCSHVVMHPTLRLPLWIITYWTKVFGLHETRAPWVLAEEALQKRQRASMKNSETRELLDDVFLALSTLEWSGNTKGCGYDEPINVLAAFATRQWLTTTHENQLLHLLSRDLIHDSAARRLHIEDLQFWTYIKQFYDNRDSETYTNSKYFAYARGVGQSLSCGDRDTLLTVTNVHGNHWVAWDLDFKDSCIQYGDSFKKEAPEEMMKAVEWWTYFHTGRHFSKESLAITRQEDNYSCGLLALNAIAHRVNPRRYPLIKTTDMDNERLRAMLKVIACHTTRTVSLGNWHLIQNVLPKNGRAHFYLEKTAETSRSNLQ